MNYDVLNSTPLPRRKAPLTAARECSIPWHPLQLGVLGELKRSPSLPKPQWVSWKGTLSSRGYWRFEARKGGRWKYVEGAEMNEKVYH